jgi:hypothetical protein
VLSNYSRSPSTDGISSITVIASVPELNCHTLYVCNEEEETEQQPRLHVNGTVYYRPDLQGAIECYNIAIIPQHVVLWRHEFSLVPYLQPLQTQYFRRNNCFSQQMYSRQTELLQPSSLQQTDRQTELLQPSSLQQTDRQTDRTIWARKCTADRQNCLS